MPKIRRGRSKCPTCGLNLEHLLNGLAGKDFRKAEEDEYYSAIVCSKCKTHLVLLR